MHDGAMPDGDAVSYAAAGVFPTHMDDHALFHCGTVSDRYGTAMGITANYCLRAYIAIWPYSHVSYHYR